MKSILSVCQTFCLFLPTAFLLVAAHAQNPQPAGTTWEPNYPPKSDLFPPTAESHRKPGIAAGENISVEIKSSKIFPGTTHHIQVYVPAAYDGKRPGALYVGLDGLGYSAPDVIDNLIDEHAMPVTIAVGVAPGVVSSARQGENPRFNRSFEFDSVSDRLARFLIEEVVPAIEQQKTSKGIPLRISSDPNDHAIGGGSTGGIGSFVAAFERPDLFRRVFSSIGTYVGMRGGERLYIQVRKSEPRPIRVFLQDGVWDGWGGGVQMGDWWMSNQTMERALVSAGYDVRHQWGSGTHNGAHATQLFPEAMRWLWSGWPTPLAAMPANNQRLKDVLDPATEFQLAAEICPADAHLKLSADAKGQVYLGGSPLQHALCPQGNNTLPQTFAADGTRWIALPTGGIAPVTDAVGTPVARFGKDLHIVAFRARNNGDFYALATSKSSSDRSELWLLRSNGEQLCLDSDLPQTAALTFSPDELWLTILAPGSRFGQDYRVLADGTLDARSPYYIFETSPEEDNARAQALAMDSAGRAYAATSLGIQIMDRNGRVVGILPMPEAKAADSLTFGSSKPGESGFDTLYVVSGSKVYQRHMHTEGLAPAAPPIVLPKWSPA